MYNENVHHRKTIRINEYDYSTNGMYYITICTHNRQKILGEIIEYNVGAKVAPCPKEINIKLSKIGRILEEEILKTNEIRENIEITQYVIMPNHIHMIVEINKKGTVPRAPTFEQFGKPTKRTIPTTIRYLKGSVTRRLYQEYGINKSIWQRNYYEHIIRNERELIEIMEYIENNPINWTTDELYK